MKEPSQHKKQDVAYSFGESEILQHSQKALNELGVDTEQCVYRGKWHMWADQLLRALLRWTSRIQSSAVGLSGIVH